MLVRLTIGLIALIGLTAFAPAPLPRPRKAEPVKSLIAQLQGTWQTVSRERMLNGRKVVTRLVSSQKIRIEGDKWGFVYTNADGTERYSVPYRIQLDTSKKPAWMDLLRTTGVANARPYQIGAVSVEGGRLKFCYVLGSRVGVARPTRTDQPGDGHTLMILERVK